MSAHPLRWQAPQPLWGRFDSGAAAGDQQCPAILRFATDDFMEQLLAALARDPSQIDRFVARPESWRSPMRPAPDLVEHTPLPLAARDARRKLFARRPKPVLAPTTDAAADPNAQGAPATLPLKLYQPAHQRYYVVAASLVCGVAGLPDRALATGGAEQVGFVIRRLLPESTGSTVLREFAWVPGSDGPRWQRVASAADDATPVFGEETLPLFPLACRDGGDDSRGRRLWGGLVPVGRREAYITGSVERTPQQPYAAAQRAALDVAEPTQAPSKMARLAQFQSAVAEPWKNLVRASVKLADAMAQPVAVGSETEPNPSPGKRKRLFEFNLGQQHAAWLVLLDCADFLSQHLPDLWAVIAAGGQGLAALSQPRRDLHDWLAAAQMTPALRQALKAADADADIRPPAASLRDALGAIRASGVRARLEATPLSYTRDPASRDSADWPPFHFLLAGVDNTNAAAGPYTTLVAPEPPIGPDTAPEAHALDALSALVGRALDATLETNAPPLPFALQMKLALAATAGDPGWFVIRCVHARRDCGPLHLPLLSPPTQRFQLASFFDADAPARPIRIALPLDTSTAGLRKHDKNAAFILSDMLCGQVQRAKGLGLIDLVLSVLPWPLHKDLDVGPGGPCRDSQSSIGMICSLSIPIITICALILLIIIVSLLDLIFRWMPFFMLCFPVPKLKGKSP